MFTGLLGFQAIATSLHVQRGQAVKQGRYLEASLMQGGAMLSVIRMIAQYLERGQATRTSPAGAIWPCPTRASASSNSPSSRTADS